MDTDNKSGDDVRLEFNDIFNCGSDITQGNTQNDQHAGIEGGAESGNRRCQSPAIAIPQKGMPHHNKKRTYDINGADPSSGDPTPTVSTHVKPEADEAPFTGGSLSFTALFEYNHGDAESTILDHKSSDMVIPQNGASPQIQADQQQPASTINDFNATSVVKFTLQIYSRCFPYSRPGRQYTRSKLWA